MTTPRRRRPAVSDDSGATLVLALVIVTAVAVLVSGLLTFADTSVRATVGLRDQAAAAATADGAAQAAINELRTSGSNNATTAAQCFQAADGAWSEASRVFSDLVPGSTGKPANSARVECSIDKSTGASGDLVPITAANRPGNAILTLSTNPAEVGLQVQANSTSIPFSVKGGIISNSSIAVTNGSLQTTTYAYGGTTCTGTIVSNPPVQCPRGGLPGDPNYAPDTTTVPTYRTVPTNVASNCPGKVVTFQPGYYDDAYALSDLMSGNGACKDSVWWFKPGVYYFDFKNASGAVPGMGGSTDEWLIRDGQLIAGTPVDAAGSPMTTPVNPMSVPGACQNPITSTSAQGVQFIFGGDSRLRVANDADVEICGTYSATKPPLAVYGVKSGSATQTVVPDAVAQTVTATGYTVPGGDLRSALATTGGTAVSWTGARNDTGTLQLSNLLPAPAIPAGSILDSARLRIVYGASVKATRTVTVTPSSGAAAGTPFDVSPSGAALPAGTQTVDLTAGLAATVHSGGLTGLALSYKSRLGDPGTESIDAVYLDLTYTQPAFRAQSGCIAAVYTGGSGGQCAVISTPESYSGRFYIQGTTYTPLAPIDIALSNITEQVLRFGVISRVLWLKETGSISYSGPVIEIPDDSPGYGPGGTVFFLTVFVCPEASTCSTGGDRSIVARVYAHDTAGSPTAAGNHRQMIVQSWAVIR
ncbi:hypothetical protein [Geodermatophilus sp. SYSU D00684]